MGICKYCGKNAGFFKSKHSECEQLYNEYLTEMQQASDIEQVVSCIVDKTTKNITTSLLSKNEWEDYKSSARGSYDTAPDKMPISKEKLIEKLCSVLGKKDIKTINELDSLDGHINFDMLEFISWNTQPYRFLVTSLRQLAKQGHIEICKKLFPIIDEYIEVSTDLYIINIYWGYVVEIYWKNKEDAASYSNARSYCDRMIKKSKPISDFIRAIGYPLSEHIGYKRMLMILEKEKDFNQIIQLCEKAKNEGWKGDWDSRIEKAKQKLAK